MSKKRLEFDLGETRQCRQNQMRWQACKGITDFRTPRGIIHAPNLTVIEQHLKKLDKQSLVIFDIDYTLIVPNDRILAPCGEEYLRQFIQNQRNMSNEAGKSEELLGSIVALQAQVSLVDERILSLLAKLKEKNIRTIALTAMVPGHFGQISSVEDWRNQQLASFGIDFNNSFPQTNFTLLSDEKSWQSVVFKHGILFSGSESKGKALRAFLQQMNWRPSTIFFIDDRIKYIDSVEKELQEMQIPHQSFHYTAAIDLPVTLDCALADFQLKYLIEHRQWLSEDDVKKKHIDEQIKP